jgi:hypothetical protein
MKGLHKVVLQAWYKQLLKHMASYKQPLAKMLYQCHKYEVVFKIKKGKISMAD